MPNPTTQGALVIPATVGTRVAAVPTTATTIPAARTNPANAAPEYARPANFDPWAAAEPGAVARRTAPDADAAADLLRAPLTRSW